MTIALAAELAQCFRHEGAMTRPQVQTRRRVMTDSEKRHPTIAIPSTRSTH
jgi:hypothetical protein